ncbi:MAG: hypothetical protein IJ344_04095 [Clostridia bacterium]|nr:hypothetical protein [Clostridia bacterium]
MDACLEKKTKKAYLDKHDVMARYNVGDTVAQRIMRQVKAVNGGTLAIGKGKILLRELERWEQGRF